MLSNFVGYKTQSGISNLENRATGTGGNKIVAIAACLRVPVEWLLNGPDSTDVPFLRGDNIENQPTPDIQVGLVAMQPNLNEKLIAFPSGQGDQDPWIDAALQILRDLDQGQRQAMVAKMREFRQYLGPPRDGQTLSVAG